MVGINSKVKPTRALLSWDEIRAIESSWKTDIRPGSEDVRKLVKHLRFVEHMNGILADQVQELKKGPTFRPAPLTGISTQQAAEEISGSSPGPDTTATPSCKRNVKRYRKALTIAVKALQFYADAETYLAIGFLPDRPCGEFMKDFERTPDLGYKPGKRARKAFEKLAKLFEENTQ